MLQLHCATQHQYIQICNGRQNNKTSVFSFPSFICLPVASLKKICKAIAEAKDDEERMKAFAPIQEMITFVQFANDECDYGMGYELGIDLFCYGSHVR